MARPERPLHPSTGPLAAFAAGLRELRRRAGSPPYRVLAARAYYSATTLSAAAAGNRLPTLAVTLAYAGACDGDEQEWARRWRETAAALNGHAVAGTGPNGSPGPPGSAGGAPPDCPPGARPGGQVPEPGPTLAAAEVRGEDGTPIGHLELRYSPGCRAAWLRFTPAGAGTSQRMQVVLGVERATSTTAAATFTSQVRDGAVHSDLLLTSPGCVTARATVVVSPVNHPR